jgi:hypothetical protein
MICKHSEKNIPDLAETVINFAERGAHASHTILVKNGSVQRYLCTTSRRILRCVRQIHNDSAAVDSSISR